MTKTDRSSPGTAPPKSTAGGGFAFEDKVVAWFLAGMIASEPPLGPGLGLAERLDFQTGPDGWLLDDLLVTSRAPSGIGHRIAVSIKSNPQFSGSAPPADHVRAVWTQYLHARPCAFDRSADFLALATSPIDAALVADLDFVISTAAGTDAALLPRRYATDGWANSTRRALFEYFACPGGLDPTGSETPETRGGLLARLRFLQFDFESPVSERWNQGIARCRLALRSGDLGEAQQLWSTLLELAAARRPVAGTLRRNDLIDLLRGTFRLQATPHHQPDRDRLLQLARLQVQGVRDVIGTEINIARPAAMSVLRDSVSNTKVTVLTGEPGTGKSAIVKALTDASLADGNLAIWVDAARLAGKDYSSFEADLRLTYPLAEILSDAPDSAPMLVLDGFDRNYDPSVVATAAMLLRAAGILGRSHWRVVLPMRSDEWARVAKDFQRAGVPALMWKTVECPAPSLDELDPVWSAAPQLGRLKRHPATHAVLTNLKILDVVASRVLAGTEVPASDWVGESSVADWFWAEVVGRGANGPARRLFAMNLAASQADTLRPRSSLQELEKADVALLPELVGDRVCIHDDNDQVRFEHSVYRDWACLRSLVAAGDQIGPKLREKAGLPSWHRAIRLYAVRLLERPETRGNWTNLLADLEKEGPESLVDLVLEAPAFSLNAYRLLDEARAALLQPGRLTRLLGRFLAFATQPDPMTLALFARTGDPSAIAAQFRLPVWHLWPPVVAFIHRHRHELVPVAPEHIEQLATMWLKHAPVGSVYRKEVAELAVMLGRMAHADRVRHDSGGGRGRRKHYELLLLAAGEATTEVVEVALQAAGRRGQRPQSRRARSATAVPRSVMHFPGFDADAPDPTPWPDGPRWMVDAAFRAAVLEGGDLAPLIKAAPEAAVEICLATLIEVPKHAWNRHHLDDMALGLDGDVRWHPPFYTDGPFLQFLLTHFEHGLELIARLVDFATDQWLVRTERQSAERARSSTPDGGARPELAALMAEWLRPPERAAVLLESGPKAFLGDARVFGWFTGVGNPPSAVQAALMALEQYLYVQLDAAVPVDEKVAAVLLRARSTAFLGVLSIVALRDPSLLLGCLKPLLVAPDLLMWDIERMVHGRAPFMFAGLNRGDWILRLMRKFGDQPHRQLNLRDVAFKLYVSDGTARQALNEARELWQKEVVAMPEGGRRESLQRLITLFDIRNYRLDPGPDGYVYLTNKVIEAQQAADSDERDAEQLVQSSVFLPLNARRILDETITLTEAEVVQLWDTLQKLYQAHTVVPAETNDDAKVNSPARVANALAAGSAVLIVGHLDWLRRHPGRLEWCTATIQEIVQSPPVADSLDSPRSVSTWTWDCFAAAAAPALLVNAPGDTAVRELVAALVGSKHYVAVRELFRACAQRRDGLGRDFSCLRRLLTDWAYVRRLLEEVEHLAGWRDGVTPEFVESLQATADDWWEAAIGAFVVGNAPGWTRGWTTPSVTARFEQWEALLADRLPHYRFDVELVLHAHDWMPRTPAGLGASDQSEWIGFWLEFGDLVLSRAEGRDDRKRDSIPHETEIRVLERLGALVEALGLGEVADPVWRRTLRLPKGHPYWAEVFLRTFHRAGLAQDPVPGRYVRAYSAIVTAALDLRDSGEGAHWPYHDDVWSILVAFDGSCRSAWGERHAVLAFECRAVIERWVKGISTGSLLDSFVRWLVLPAASRVRILALQWVQEAIAGHRKMWRVEDAEDGIASLVALAWDEDAARLQQDGQAFTAFRALLRWCADRQSPRALELLGRMGGLA